jgi:hypothetical protein
MSDRFADGAELVAETTRAGTITLYFVDVDGTRKAVRSGARRPR